MGERTAGPFEYFQDIHGGVNGDTIRADAQDPGLKAGTIQALAGELEGDSQKVAGQLSGDITADVQANPKTASDTAKALAAKGHYAVGLIGSFAGMVDAFDSTVNDLNHRYKTDLASAMRYAGQAAAATEDKADDAKVTEAGMGPAIKANLQPEYKAAVAKLDNDADSIASKFKQGATTANVRELIKAGLIPLSAAAFYPGLELTAAEKTSYWRNTLGNMTSQQQIDWINAHKDELPPEAAEFVQPDVQEHFAEEVANDIKDPDDIDQDTVNLLTFLSNEQPFSHQLYTDVSPDEMSDAIRSLSSDAFPAQDQRPMHDRVENAQLYKGFLDAAGVAFATYTKGTGAYAPPSDLADTYFKAITDDDHPSNAAALTMLIRHGGEQTSIEENFIRDLTGRTYEWELSHDGDPVWGPRNDDEYGIKDPTTVDTGDPDDPYDDIRHRTQRRRRSRQPPRRHGELAAGGQGLLHGRLRRLHPEPRGADGLPGRRRRGSHLGPRRRQRRRRRPGQGLGGGNGRRGEPDRRRHRDRQPAVPEHRGARRRRRRHDHQRMAHRT